MRWVFFVFASILPRAGPPHTPILNLFPKSHRNRRTTWWKCWVYVKLVEIVVMVEGSIRLQIGKSIFFFFLIWLNSTARSCLSKHQKSLGARKVLVFSSSFINPPPRQNIFSLVYSISHSYRSGIEGIEWKSLRGNFFFPVEVSSKEKKNKCTKNKKNRSQSLEWDMWPTTGEEWRFDKARRSYVSELESSDTPYLDLELIGVTNN